MRPPPCLAGTFRRAHRPPTHFFVKKKFIPIGGAESTTQKVPSGLSYAHTLCGGGTLCHARNPPAIRFAPGPPPAASSEAEYKGGKRFLRLTKFEQKSPCGAGSIRTQGGAFFFTKKASCGNQTLCVAGGGSLYRLDPPHFPPLKKPLKITGSKGI